MKTIVFKLKAAYYYDFIYKLLFNYKVARPLLILVNNNICNANNPNAPAAVAPSHSKKDTNAETSLSKDSPLVRNHFNSIIATLHKSCV